MIRDWLPYLAIVGAFATVLTINKNYVNNIREETAKDTASDIALSNLGNKVTTLTETVQQSIETLKSQTWTDTQNLTAKVQANDARIDALTEKLHAIDKQRLQDEINRLKAAQ